MGGRSAGGGEIPAERKKMIRLQGLELSTWTAASRVNSEEVGRRVTADPGRGTGCSHRVLGPVQTGLPGL